MHRELAWLSGKMYNIQIKVRSATTLLCSIRSQPDRISEISAWISSAVTKLVIDTPCPALAEAIYNATGVRLTELPMTPEKIAMEILKNRESTRSGTKVEE